MSNREKVTPLKVVRGLREELVFRWENDFHVKHHVSKMLGLGLGQWLEMRNALVKGHERERGSAHAPK